MKTIEENNIKDVLSLTTEHSNLIFEKDENNNTAFDIAIDLYKFYNSYEKNAFNLEWFNNLKTIITILNDPSPCKAGSIIGLLN